MEKKLARDVRKLSKMPRIQNNDWKLNDEVTMSIFACLPLEQIAELKLVSKKWYILSSSPLFAKFYATYSPFRNLQSLIFQVDYRISTLNHTTPIVTENLVTEEFDDHGLPTPPFININNSYYCAGSSHGIVCLLVTAWNEQSAYHYRILLWNPLTKEIRDIPPPQSVFWLPRTLEEPTLAWFGYVESLKDYVIFIIREGFRFSYSFRKLEWNVLADDEFSVLMKQIENNSTRNNGSRFHLRDDRFLYCSIAYESLLKYDLVSNNFEILPFLPQSKRAVIHLGRNYNLAEASIAVGKDTSKLYCIMIYATQDIGEDQVLGQQEEQEEENVGVVEQEEEDGGEGEQEGEGVDGEDEEEVEGEGELVVSREWLVEKCLLHDGEWKTLIFMDLGQETPWLEPLMQPSIARLTFDDKIFAGAEDLVVVHPHEDVTLRILRVDNDVRAVFAVNHVDTMLSPHWLDMITHFGPKPPVSNVPSLHQSDT